MSQELTIQLSDTTFSQLETVANSQARTPAELAGDAVVQMLKVASSRAKHRQLTPEELAAALKDFEKHIGAVHVPHAVGADNEQIDADLAREYADTHES